MGSRNLNIYCEGKADVNFLIHFLNHIFIGLEVIEKDISDTMLFAKIKYTDFEVRIQSTGGYSSIHNHATDIKQNNALGEAVIVLQDADSLTKDHGTCIKRMQYLDEIKKRNKIEFKSYLLPNNHDDGDLETLLLRIVTKTKYQDFSKCYSNYQESIKMQVSEEKNIGNISDKSVIFHYCYNVLDLKYPAEHRREYKVSEWNFEHQDLKPLKSLILTSFEDKEGVS